MSPEILIITWEAPSIGRLEQRAGNCLLDCFERLVVALGLSDTDVCDTLVLHDCLYICKVQIDQCREINQVCDTLNCLLQHLICLLQCLRHCRPAVYNLKQLVIRDDDQRVNILLQTLVPASALFMRVRASKRNGFVTTPTVRIPISFAIPATTGAAPVPVPPPIPQVTNTMSAP